MVSSSNSGTNQKSAKTANPVRNAIFIIPLIALIGIIWLILIRIDQLPESLTFGWEFNSWLNFWMVILVILIVILICIPQTGEHSKPEETVEVTKLETSKKVKKQLKAKPALVESVDSDEEPMEFLPVSKKTGAGGMGFSDLDVKVSSTNQKASTPTSSKVKKSVKTADIVAPAAKKDKIRPNVIEYPLEVEGGIYGDTFIDIKNDTVVKLRTLVVEDIYLL
jgi:hypothetical protein